MTFDVEIGGQGYMVVPGTYSRTQDGIGESRIGRVRVFDFFGGGQRAAQLERDRFWHGAGAWPAFDSQGVVPGPRRTDYIESLAPSEEYDPGERTWFTLWKGTAYVAQGDRVYEVTTDGSGNYDGLSLLQTTTQDIVDAAAVRGKWYFAHGAGATMSMYDLEDGTYTTDALGSGSAREAATIGRHYAWVTFQTEQDTVPTHSVSIVQITTTDRDWRYVSSPVLALVEHQGACWFATRHGLYRFTITGVDEVATFTADYVAEASLPQMGYDDDLRWVVSHMGELWLWMGKEVHRYDAANGVVEPMGLRGRETMGACSVGRYLVVNIKDEISGKLVLWAWDGRGWWLLDDEQDYGWPVALWGVAADADLMAGRTSTNNHTALWQFFARSGEPGYRDDMTLTSSLLDAGERDLEKVWRKIGAIFAWPDDRSSGVQDVTVELEYSTDAGETWTTLTTDVVSSSDGTVELSSELGSVVRSRFLQLRVSMSNVDDWAPVLLGMWAEHETLDLEVRRRRWRFKVEASDTVVDRDGAPVGDARAISDALWDAWADRIVSFRDVDYDYDPVEYTVRVAALSETVAYPRDAAGIATAELEIALVEV